MRPYSLHHVHFFTRDIGVMTRFWIEGFGAQIAQQREIDGMPATDLDFPEGSRLTLQQKDCGERETLPCAGIDHIGFLVPDLAAALEHLLALPGVSLHKDVAVSPLYRYAFVQGPEGCLVEVLEKNEAV